MQIQGRILNLCKRGTWLSAESDFNCQLDFQVESEPHEAVMTVNETTLWEISL